MKLYDRKITLAEEIISSDSSHGERSWHVEQEVAQMSVTDLSNSSNNSSTGYFENETTERTDMAVNLELHLGAKRGDIVSVWILTVVYTLIFLSGISGNICTCIVIARNSYMRTATNFYLFSLAISDMLTLIFGLPSELYGIWEAYPWIFGEPYCIFKSYLAEMTSYASILTITSFTVERYVAICHPIKAQTLSKTSRALKMVVLIWICSCLFASPYAVHTRLFPYVVVNGTGVKESMLCNIPFKWQGGMTYAFQISTFLFFVFPMAIICIMYALIGARLSKSQLETKHKAKTKARKAVIRMLVAVVVAFFCLWAPFHAQRLMTSYVPLEMWTPALIRFQSDLFYVSGVLYFFNSTINPILYNLMSKKFRMAFKRTLCRHCYSSEELMDINGKSKSVYCSDRSTFRSVRQLNPKISKISLSDPSAYTSGNNLLNGDNNKQVPYRQVRGGWRSRFYQSHSMGRLNDFFNDLDKCDKRHAQSASRVLESKSSPDSSMTSFPVTECESVIEMKSMSSVASSSHLNSKLIHMCNNNKRFRIPRGSFV